MNQCRCLLSDCISCTTIFTQSLVGLLPVIPPMMAPALLMASAILSGKRASSKLNHSTCMHPFLCTHTHSAMGYGLYVPLSKVLLEMESAYV